MTMDARKQRVLQAIVALYGLEGEPVGSSVLANYFDMAVSSATLRNEMAALTKLGLLEQPHTSAGRVPSAKGYRYYLDHLLTDDQPLDRVTRARVDAVFASLDHEPEKLAQGAAKALAALAGEDIQSYAEQMFEAGADLTGRTAEDVFSSDFKAFSRGDVKFGVGQSTYMTDKSRAAAEALVQPFLPEASRREGLPLIFYMFTDMKTQSTDLMFYGHNAEEIIRDAFHVEPEGNIAKLPGVVSRKKQLIPPLLAALQARQ